MLCHLEKERGYTIENPEEGIYYVIGEQNTYPGNCNFTIKSQEKFVALQLD